MSLRICLWPNGILTSQSGDVISFDDDLKCIVAEMGVLMSKIGGIGLAAPQVGLSKRFFVMQDLDDRNVVNFFANPEIIIDNPEKIQFSEGCLSLPNQDVVVNRHKEIRVRYYNLDGEKMECVLDGIESVCFQHENDHIMGLTILDKITDSKERELAKKKMTAQKAILVRDMPDIYI